MKVGSDREAASSPDAANAAVAEIGSNHVGLCAGGPSKIAPASGEQGPKKIRVGTGAKRARNARLLVGTCANRNCACNLMPLLLRK